MPPRFWNASQWFVDVAVNALIPVIPVATGFDKDTEHRSESRRGIARVLPEFVFLMVFIIGEFPVRGMKIGLKGPSGNS
jgi:hypothetical protein